MSVSSTTQIYTIRSSDFDIEGTKYDVSTVSMEITSNSIPTCTVGIAPNDGAGYKDKTPVNALDVSSLQQLYKELSKKAEELKESNLFIDLMASGDRKLPIETSIRLKKWLLIGVGLTRVSTTQGFSIMCTLAHPAYKLTLRTGFFFTSKGTVNFDEKSKEALNPVDAAIKCIETVKDANSEQGGITVPFSDGVPTSAGFKNFTEISEDINKSIDDLLNDIKGADGSAPLIKWDKETYANAKWDIPCENTVNQITGGTDAMKYVLVSTWANAMNQSAWDALVGSVCPSFGLEVIPKYDDDSMIVSPWMPWTKPKIEFPDYMIESMLLPGKDPDPIYGYILYEGDSSNPANPLVTMPNEPGENVLIGLANMAFVPKESKASVGRLVHASRPPWLDTAIHKAASAMEMPPVTHGDGSGVDPDLEDEHAEQPGGAAGDNDNLKAWNAVIYSHLNNLFLAEYKKGIVAELACAFVPKYKGELIYPGIRMAVKTGDTTMFTGRITTVRHVIDCASSRASTSISMAYCLNGDESTLLGTSPESPFYGAQGTLTG